MQHFGKSSNAEIWTINLPSGEIDDAGNSVYGCDDLMARMVMNDWRRQQRDQPTVAS